MRGAASNGFALSLSRAGLVLRNNRPARCDATLYVGAQPVGTFRIERGAALLVDLPTAHAAHLPISADFLPERICVQRRGDPNDVCAAPSALRDVDYTNHTTLCLD
jgi:hypothetical protein